NKEIGAIYTDIGYLYAKWGESEKAEENCRKAIEIEKRIGNLYGLANAYCNLGKVYESVDRLEAAVKAYQQSRDLFQTQQNTGGLAWADVWLGEELISLGRGSEAQSALEEALRLAEKNGLKETYNRARELVLGLKG